MKKNRLTEKQFNEKIRETDKKLIERLNQELNNNLNLQPDELNRIRCDIAIIEQRQTNTSARRINQGINYLPFFIIETILEILEGRTYDTAFDPFAGNGILLSTLIDSGIGNNGKGICISPLDFAFSELYSENLPIQWKLADPFQTINVCNKEFDLIVSYPPWGLRAIDSFEHFPQFNGISSTNEELLILAACLRLKTDGVGIFIMPSRFVSKDRTRGVMANLGRFGLALDAFLALPQKTFAPLTFIQGGIAIIRKGSQTPVFTGLVSNDPIQRKLLIDNYIERIQSKDYTLGTLIDFNEFRGYAPLEVQNRINRIGKKFGYPTHPFCYPLVTQINVAHSEQGFIEKDNAIYLPRISRKDVVTILSQLTLKPQQYFQIELNPDLADAEYIAAHLNSQLGYNLREYGTSGGLNQQLSRSSINFMSVFLPPLDVQKKLVLANRQVTQIEMDLNNIKDQLWTEPRKIKTFQPKLNRLTREESFEEWLDTLPYPLASILWTYHTAGKDEKSRLQHLQNFFEAAAIFFATILISGAKKDTELWNTKIPEILDNLKKEKLSFEKSSFGTWSNTFSALAKEIRRIKDKDIESRERVYHIFGTHDPEVISLISSKELSSLFQENNTLRNKWKGHTGIIGDTEAERRHELLKPHLHTVQKVIGSTLNHYHLINPGRLDRLSDGYHQDILLVKGTRSRFLSAQIDLDEGLKKGYLYLIGDGEREGLELLPFIRLSSSPKEESNACYFYNSKEPNNYRYISYHFEPIPEMPVPFSDLTKSFDCLLNSSNQVPIPNPGDE